MSRLARNLWIVMLMGVVLTSGCSKPSNNDKLTVSNIRSNIEDEGNQGELVLDNVLKFSDTMEKVNKLDGKEVKMTGYMSLMSPLDGSYIYLMNLPLQNCPFCVPNTTEITNTVACYAPEGQQIEYTENPVVITGTVKVGNFSDDMGYNYPFKLADIKVEEADTEKMAENYRIYSAVTDLLPRIYDALNWVSINGDYETYGVTYEDVMADLMPEDRLNPTIAKLRALSEEDYADLITICRDITAYNKKINEKLNKGKDEKVNTPELIEDINVIWMKFNMWIQKYEI